MIHIIASFTFVLSILGLVGCSIAVNETDDEINRSLFIYGTALSTMGIFVSMIMFVSWG